MTINELGQRVKSKDPAFSNLSPTDAGERYLAQHPVGWEHIDDGVLAEHLLKLKESSRTDTSGIGAFFGKLGERQRTEFFEQRRQTAAAIVGLEELQNKLHDLNLARQIGIANAGQVIAAAKFAIFKLGVETTIVSMAATAGMTLDAYVEFRKAQEAQQLAEKSAEGAFQRETKARDQIHTHDVGNRQLDSDLRIREAQNTHILQQQIEELKNTLELRIKAKEQENAVEIERLRSELRERETSLEYNLKQQTMAANVEGVIRLYNKEDAARAYKLSKLEGYYQKLQSATIEGMKTNYQKEIDKLEKELYGDGLGQMGGQTVPGSESGGGAASSQPGNNPQASPGSSDKSDTGTHSGPVN